jgi:hypothetical protein
MTADVAALAERVEKATGPSRELDAEIAYAVDPDFPREFTRMDPDIGLVSEGWEMARKFTASVDAALRLLPKGWDVVEADSNGGLWCVVLGCGDLNHPAYREAWSWPGEDRERGIFHRKPLALALTAAILRARSAKL